MSIVVQSLSHVWLFATPYIVACQAPLSSTISRREQYSISYDTAIVEKNIFKTHMCIEWSPFAVQQKLVQQCKSSILQKEKDTCLWKTKSVGGGRPGKGNQHLLNSSSGQALCSMFNIFHIIERSHSWRICNISPFTDQEAKVYQELAACSSMLGM